MTASSLLEEPTVRGRARPPAAHPGVCRACGAAMSGNIRLRVPGRRLREALYTDELRARVPELRYERCTGCGSLWAGDARCEAELLASLYEVLPPAYWLALRPDDRLYRAMETRLRRWAPGPDVYDVGCGNGDFLASLPPIWRTQGLEPGREAVEHCRARGLQVMQGTAQRAQLANVADAVTCIDVLEHLLDPAPELAAMTAMLRPGGVLIILTGAPDAWTARCAGAAWEYVHCVGHVSILSRAALRTLVRRNNLVILEQCIFPHASGVSLARWARCIGANLWQTLRRRRGERVPYCHDHQLLVARKPEAVNAHPSRRGPTGGSNASTF